MAIPPKQLLVIDGGMAMQLQKHVTEDVEGHPLWTSLFNSINPKAVIKTHLDFLNAGSDFFHANTYQASVEGFMKHFNLSEAGGIELIKSSVRLAHEARTIFLKESGRENQTDSMLQYTLNSLWFIVKQIKIDLTCRYSNGSGFNWSIRCPFE